MVRALLVLLLAISPCCLSAALAEEDPWLAEASRRFLKEHDRDGDGKLAREEFPEPLRAQFARLDEDGDGFVTLAEDLRARTRRAGPRPGARSLAPQPTHSNVRYGPHERNVLDLWLADGGDGQPTPLVIYIHGGGFRGGDKRTVNAGLIEKLSTQHVSMAAINYRLSSTAPFPAPMLDAARAVQFLRLHAAEYRLDSTRFAATGGSAGAGISLWLAFHDDLAEPESEDPLLRQSTRISTAVVYAGQSSYDPRFIQKLFDTDLVDRALIPFYGMTGPEDVTDPRFHPLFVEASPINHVTADDPGVYLFYPQPNDPLPPGSAGGRHIHHPKFGFALKEKMDELGLECVIRLRKDVPGRDPTNEYVAFFLRWFGRAP